MASFIPSFRDFTQPDIINVTPNKIVKQSNSPLDAANIPVVYGLRRITPPRIFTRISDQDPNTLICVYALSMGECLGIYRLFVDDVYVQTDTAMAIDETNIPADSTNRTVVNPLGTSIFSGVAQFEFLAGNERAMYDDYNGSIARVDGFESKLLVQHIKNAGDRPTYDDDLCLLVCTFTDDGTDENPYNQIPVITLDLFGRRVRSSGLVNDTYLNRSYSINPVECLFDYMTNGEYGCDMPVGIFDGLETGTSWDDVRDYCDVTEVTQIDDGSQISNTRYTMNKVLDTGTDRISNVLEILKTYLFLMPWIDGKFKLFEEGQGTPEVTINEDSIVSEFRITYPEANTRYNSVTYNYIEPQIGFSSVRRVFPAATSTEYTTYLAEDNGNVRNLELSLTGVTNVLQAERIAKTYLLKSRLQAKYEFTVVKDFFKYRVGDIVNFSSNVPSLTLVPIRIVKMTVLDNDLITVEAYSHTNSFYTPFPDFTTQKPTYTQPLIPGTGGVIQPGGDDIGINPPGGDDGNPGGDQPGPTPIVPDPDPEPTPIPDYAYTLVSGSLDTVGGATDKYPYRFYEGAIAAGDLFAATKEDGEYFPSPITFWDRNCATHTRFVNHTYRLCMTIVDRLAPDNARLAMVYQLPNNKYGICRKEQNTLAPDFYFWDPETPTDTVEVYNTTLGQNTITYQTFKGYALELARNTKRNTKFPTRSFEGFYDFYFNNPEIYPTGGGFNNEHRDIHKQRIIRHYMNPMVGKPNFVGDDTSFTFRYKLYHPVTLEYYGSGEVLMGPQQITGTDAEASSQQEYFVASHQNYPGIPF